MSDAVWDSRAPTRSHPPAPDGEGPRVILVHPGPFAPRMMSDRANAWVEGDTVYVFAGSRDTGGPLFFGVDLATEQVTARPDLNVPYGGETEFWYWTPDGYLMIGSGLQLHRVDPRNGSDEIVMDASVIPDAHMIDQWHSSDDGRTHSATVKNAAYQKIGTIITGPHGQRFEAAVGQLDESQPTRTGSHIVIKQNGEDNRIINLATGEVWDLADADGAIGHSDCGPDFIVGESNLPGPGRCVKLDLRTHERTDLFLTDNMGYVSVRGGRCLHSGDTHLSLVAMDGSGSTPLIAHGGGSAYDDRVKANLSPCARVACYMVGGAVYLLVL
jgi:hypothetical protein